MSNVYVHFSQISFPARYSVVNFQLESHSLRFREVIKLLKSCSSFEYFLSPFCLPAVILKAQFLRRIPYWHAPRFSAPGAASPHGHITVRRSFTCQCTAWYEITTCNHHIGFPLTGTILLRYYGCNRYY